MSYLLYRPSIIFFTLDTVFQSNRVMTAMHIFFSGVASPNQSEASGAVSVGRPVMRAATSPSLPNLNDHMYVGAQLHHTLFMILSLKFIVPYNGAG